MHADIVLTTVEVVIIASLGTHPPKSCPSSSPHSSLDRPPSRCSRWAPAGLSASASNGQLCEFYLKYCSFREHRVHPLLLTRMSYREVAGEEREAWEWTCLSRTGNPALSWTTAQPLRARGSSQVVQPQPSGDLETCHLQKIVAKE